MTSSTAVPIPDSMLHPAIPEAMSAPARPDPASVRTAIEKRTFCTPATTSPAGHAHVAGVLYALAGDVMFVSTMRSSRKARNVATTGTAAVCIPVRRLPIGPPSSIQFQASAQMVALDDPELVELAANGALKAVTSHGELHAPDGCFLRITVPRVVHTYGLGLSLRQLLRDPLAAGARVELS